MQDSVVEIARAKLNLTLRVHGCRPDSYHELESIVAFADIGDIVRLTRHLPRTPPIPATLSVSGPFAGAIVGENLIARAIAMVEADRRRSLDADLQLEKHLPVASGIGGGSADAAAALRAIGKAYPDLATAVDWAGICRRLGADVPVCFDSRAAWMTGTGERLKPLELPALDIVLVNDGGPVPPDKTRRVFQALASRPLDAAFASAHTTPARLDRSTLIGLMRTTGNDLDNAAIQVLPTITTVKSAVAGSPGCEVAVLSGAGPTVIGVFPSADAARTAAQLLSQSHPSWWIRAGSTRSP